jgi:hypothetical protein
MYGKVAVEMTGHRPSQMSEILLRTTVLCIQQRAARLKDVLQIAAQVERAVVAQSRYSAARSIDGS